MPEPIVEQPVATPAPAAATPPSSDDLVTRVSQVKIQDTPAPVDLPDDVKFDFKELNNIKDPEAKTWAEKAYKSMQSGYTKKFSELAQMRKEYEAKQKELTSWSPERIQSLLNDPSFVQAAQQVAQVNNPPGSGLTDDEYSSLSDSEKRSLQEMQKEIMSLKQLNVQARTQQEDESLKVRYANYEPSKVDDLISSMRSGKVQATREHLWKAYDYENAVKRAYELGLNDRKTELTSKINSASVSGTTAVPSSDKPEREQNESAQTYLRRLFDWNRQKVLEGK